MLIHVGTSNGFTQIHFPDLHTDIDAGDTGHNIESHITGPNITHYINKVFFVKIRKYYFKSELFIL